MSTRVRRRKRQYTVDLSNDDDDDIEVIEVKRNRREDGETVFQRIRYIAKYFEEHILYNRYIKALLSAFGYYNEDTNLEIVEDFEDDEWMDAPEQEENSPPCSSLVKPDFNDMANFFRPCSRIDEGTALKNSVNYRKYGRHHNTFVTLRRPLDLYETSSKKVNSMMDHKGRPFTSELHKNTLKGKSSRSILKSANLYHGNSSSSSLCSTQTIDLTQDEDVSSATSKTMPVHYDDDDVQILSHEKKDLFNGFSSLTSEMDRHHIDYSRRIRPCGGLNGIRDLGKYHGLKTSPKSTSLKCAKLKNGFYPKISSPKLTSRTHFPHDEMRNSPNKASFTTDEVIRIQEKEQYKELLQKVCYEQSGHCEFDIFPHTTLPRARSKKSNFHEEPVSHFHADISMKKTDVLSARALKTRISSFNSFKTIPEKDEVQIIECIPKTSNEERLSEYVSSSSSSHSPDIIIENDTVPKVKEQRYQHESRNMLSSSKSASVSSASLSSFEGSFSGFNNRKRTPFINSNKQLSFHQTKKEIAVAKPTKNFFSTTKPTEIILEEEEDVPLVSTKNDCKPTNKPSTQFSYANTLNDIDLRVSSDLPAIICEGDDVNISKQEKKISVSRQTKSPIFSTNWIEDLRKTIQEEDQERNRCVKDHERQFKEYREKSVLKSEKFKDVLEREEKPSLDFQHDIYIEKEVLLPKLSPDKEALIDKILLPHAPNDVICNISNYSVLWKDIETLAGSNWLNDEIINVYMLLIQERSKLPNFPTVYAFTSFFYPKLRAQGYQAVRRWTRKVDIFAVDIIFVPLHLGVHWCLGVIDNRYKRIQYYDSMDGNENCLGLLRDYLVSECLDKKKTDFDTSGWVLEKMKDIPPQLNGSDCGMFTLKYAEYISRNAKITFTQQNMQYFRRKMVYEIVKGKII